MTPKPGTAIAPRPSPDERLADKLLALAKTPQERAAAFEALDRFRQSRMVREAATAINELSWGRPLSPYAQAAIARYALETGTDPVRHWIVLGGTKLYDTAELWLDLAASMHDYLGYTADDLSWNEGLSAKEGMQRRQKRERVGIPQDVKGACIVTIHRRDKPDVVGFNYAGNRKCFVAAKNAEGVKPDPIGEQDPAKTAETRAFRRAAKRCWPIWPYRRALPSDEGLDVLGLAPGAVEAQEGKERVEGELATEHEAAKLTSGPSGAPVQDFAHGYPETDEAVRAEDQRLADEGR